MTENVISLRGKRAERLAGAYEAALRRIVDLAGRGAEHQAILEAAEDALAEARQGRGVS